MGIAGWCEVFIHVVATDMLLFNSLIRSNSMNSQDPPSLISTSSAIFPTSSNIYLVLTKSCIILSKDNYASPAANFPFSLGKTSGLQGWTNCPGMLLGKWTISQGPWWKKILVREFLCFGNEASRDRYVGRLVSTQISKKFPHTPATSRDVVRRS